MERLSHGGSQGAVATSIPLTTFEAIQHNMKRYENDNYEENSYLDAKARFSRPNKSLKYPSEYRAGHSHDEREKNAINKALNYLEPNSSVLDLPCGTGRLTQMLVERGHKVKGADVSSDMVRMASNNYKENCKQYTTDVKAPKVDFDVVDVMRTDYKAQEFNAVVCNRLFHHFTESEIRLTALRELHRISSDVVVVSFFNSRCFDACWRRFTNWMRRKTPKDRVPISLKQFESELNTAGFEVVDRIYTHQWISPLTYIVAKPNHATT